MSFYQLGGTVRQVWKTGHCPERQGAWGALGIQQGRVGGNLRTSHTDATKQPEVQAQPGAGPSLDVRKVRHGDGTVEGTVGGQPGTTVGGTCRALSEAGMHQTQSTPAPSRKEKGHNRLW